MMAPDCRSGQSVKLTFLSKLSLIIAMVGDWGEPVDEEELDNNIKGDILPKGLFLSYGRFVSTFLSDPSPIIGNACHLLTP